MSEVATSPGRQARVTNARRRRVVTGCSIAAVILAALGLSFAIADPSLNDQIDSAQSNAGQLSNRIDSQTARIAMLTEQAHQAGAQAMVLAAQVQRAEDRSRQLGEQLAGAEHQDRKSTR